MKLNWKVGKRGGSATAEIGRFKFACTTGTRTYKDGSQQWLIYQHYCGKDSSKEIITLGKIRAHSVEEAINYAEDLISEIIPENKMGILLPDGSTLVFEGKSEGGDYPGAWIYRISPDTSAETDIAVVEMTTENDKEVNVYVYGNPEKDDYTDKISIDVSSII